MNELALFAGAGGGILGGKIHGWRTRCAVEIDSYARKVLLARQADGTLERFPIWDDVRTFDGRPWRRSVDVISGGFPCQDISSAGKRAGIGGSRSGLWFEMLRIIGEVGPRFVFAENSANLRTRGLGTVIEGFAGLGYDVRWCVLGARHVGAPHRRNRMWILAHAIGDGKQGRVSRPCDTDSESEPAFKVNDEMAVLQGLGEAFTRGESSWWDSQPKLGRVAHGMAGRMDRLRAIGNGQVPRVAAEAFAILSHGLI